MRLNIAYSSDNNYVKHVGVSMTSLFLNNVKAEEIYIYLVDNGISAENKEKLIEIADKYNRNLIFIKFNELCGGLETDNSYPLSSYARLFLSKIEGIDKIIYMDCDSIICSSLEQLWNIDIEEYYVSGVLDNVNEYYKTSIGLDKNFKYINAGFLVINLKKWRNDNLERKFIDFINKYKGSVPHHDQGTINAVCKEKIYIIHPKYNLQPPMLNFTEKEILKLDDINEYYSQTELDEAKQNPCFIHFTNGFYNRPWNIDSTHPLKDVYLYYLNQTIWKNRLENKKLCRNARIMRFLYNNIPFGFYIIIHKLLVKRKIRKLKINENTKVKLC